MPDAWTCALSLLSGTLPVEPPPWPAERTRVVRLLAEPDDQAPPAPKQPKPPKAIRPARMPKPKASRPAAPPKPTPPPVAVKRTSRVRVQAPKRATMPSQDAALAAMVGTGLMLWTAKRGKPGALPFFGYRLVQRLNIGAIACLPAGMAAFLLANRLIPATLPGRQDMEVSAMFWVWFGLAAVSLIRPVRRAWIETLTIAGAMCAAVPVVNALTTDRGLMHSIMAGDGLFLAFDIVMLASAALLGFAAWQAARKPVVVQRTRRPLVSTAPREVVDAV